MEQADPVMSAALALGPATRLAVIDGFVHRDGILYLAADTGSIGEDGAVDAERLRTSTSASRSRLLSVRTSPERVALHLATDVPLPRSYEQVMTLSLLAETDGIILHSASAWIILTRAEIQSALIRRRRLAAKASASAAAPESATEAATATEDASAL
jgi:hypothetical protein